MALLSAIEAFGYWNPVFPFYIKDFYNLQLLLCDSDNDVDSKFTFKLAVHPRSSRTFVYIGSFHTKAFIHLSNFMT